MKNVELQREKREGNEQSDEKEAHADRKEMAGECARKTREMGHGGRKRREVWDVTLKYLDA